MGKWDGKVPYDPKTGNVPHYTNGWIHEGVYPNAKRVPEPTKDNTPFVDALSNFTFSRGRSAAYATADGLEPGRRYVVFLRDLEDMIPFMKNGRIYAKFVHCKRGQNYGTKIEPAHLKEMRQREEEP